MSELFDRIEGTSTGGILALLLVKRSSPGSDVPAHKAADVVKLYSKRGSIIFPSSLSIWKRIRQWFAPKYSANGLEEILEEYFGNVPMVDALTDVEVTAFDISQGEPVLVGRENIGVGTATLRGAARGVYMREAARATAAAPTYLPPAQLPVRKSLRKEGFIPLIDGGVFANNPAQYALQRVSSDGLETGSVLLVSLGTGASLKSFPYEEAMKWGTIKWAVPVVDIALSNPATEMSMRRLPKGRYFRFQPDLKGIKGDLDDVRKKNIEELGKLARGLIAQKENDLKNLAELLTSPRPKTCPRRAGLDYNPNNP